MSLSDYLAKMEGQRMFYVFYGKKLGFPFLVLYFY